MNKTAMNPELYRDLLTIILEEAYGMQEAYARKVVTGNGAKDRRFRQADSDALAAADHIVQRIESRCRTIEG